MAIIKETRQEIDIPGVGSFYLNKTDDATGTTVKFVFPKGTVLQAFETGSFGTPGKTEVYLKFPKDN
jgi:hypothetical protein